MYPACTALLQTPGDILRYLRIMFLGTPIVMAYSLLACILRSLGDGRPAPSFGA